MLSAIIPYPRIMRPIQFTSALLISRITSTLAIALGLIVLCGWVLDINALKSVFPGLITMKPNTAVGFMLTGISLSMLAIAPDRRVAKRISKITAWLVISFGMLTFVQYIFDLNLAIDNLLFQVPPGASYNNQHPARMTPQAALIFSIFSSCILLIWHRKFLIFVQYLVLAITAVPLLTMLGYLFGVHALPLLGTYKPMAIHTSAGFALIAAGILATSSNIGIFAKLQHKLPNIAFGLALILLLLSVIASIINSQHAAASNTSHITMYEILWRLEKVATEIEHSIAANRGFAITGQEKFITSIEPSRIRMHNNLAEIRQLVTDPEQLKKLSALESLIAIRNTFGDDIIRLRQDRGLKETADVLTQDKGERINRQIRIQMDEFIQAEKNRLKQLQIQTQTEKNNALIALSLTLITGLSLIGFGLAALKIQTLKRKDAEADRNRLVAILETTTDFVGTADLHANITYINRAGRAMLNLSDQPITELNISDIHPKWAIDIIMGQGIPTAKLHGSWQGETALLTAAGFEIPVSQIILAHRNKHNDISYFSTVMRDISARKNAENALRIRDSALKTSLNAIAMTDLSGNLTYVNDSFVALWKYANAEEVLGNPFALFWQLPDQIRELMTSMFKSSQSWRGVVTGLKKSGELFDADVSASLTLGSDGKAIGIMASFLDISERKQVENKLRANEATLKEAQRLAQIGSWELDLINNKLNWSEEIFRIFEIDQTQFGASYDAFLEIVHPEDRSLVNTAYLDSVKNHGSYNIIHRLLTADGRVKYVHERGETVYRQDQAIRSIGTVQDITRAKLAEEELLLYRNDLESLVKKRTAELEAVNQELEAFAYSVSHDLRAPLRGIDGFSQALLEDYGDKLDDTGRNYLERVRGASQRMGTLIDDLLKLSRITRAILKHAQVNLSNLANMVLDLLQETNPEHQVETWVEPGLQVDGDPGLLKIALENLLGNAWKYSAKTANPHIAFGSLVQGGETVYYVSDNGAGFDMQYADKLFRPFQRLHHRDQFEGTGIGLATAKRIIHRHGGRIWAESDIDKKTTFYFTLAREEIPNDNQQSKGES